MATFETKFAHGDTVFLINTKEGDNTGDRGLWAFGPYEVGDIKLCLFAAGVRPLYDLRAIADAEGKVWTPRSEAGYGEDLFTTREEAQDEADRRWNARLQRMMR